MGNVFGLLSLVSGLWSLVVTKDQRLKTRDNMNA